MLRAATTFLGRALRETGQALDRVGARVLEKPTFMEPFSRHRPMMNLMDKHPEFPPDTFVAPNASVVGKVIANFKCTVGYGAVVRGDHAPVRMGSHVHVGDRAVVLTAKAVEGHSDAATRIGDYVVIGAGAVLQACTVEARVRVGAGARVMEGALLESYCALAPGAVVHPGRRIPSGELWEGNPARFARKLDRNELAGLQTDAEEAWDASLEHRQEFLPYSSVYMQAEALGMEKYDAALAALDGKLQERLRAEGKTL